MTKQEAIKLEKKCEKYIEEAIKDYYRDTQIMISMTLTSRLKISLGSDYVVLDKYMGNFDYIHYVGEWSDLLDIKEQILRVLVDHIEEFDKLYWSYEHIKELTDNG